MELLCPWESAEYFIYSSNIPTLFFYSHIPAIIAALMAGFLVFLKNKKSSIGATLLSISILFSAWSLIDLILWATNKPSVVVFFWSMQVLIEPLIYLLGFNLAYLFIKNKELSFRARLTTILAYLPVPILLATAHNITGVNLADCTAEEGFIAQYFTYIIEIVFVLLILFLMDSGYRQNKEEKRRKEIITFGLGVIVFLMAFSWGNLIGSFTENWTLAQAGLIGMPLFVAFLAYMIVKFHSFNIRLFGAEALVVAIWFLVLSILFIRRIENVRGAIILTLVLVTIAGYSLIKSVKKEIQRKEELQKLNKDLEDLVKQRESLMHLITHKVKGSFTHSKYIFAGMLDGTFGDISEEIRRRANQGLESSDGGIKTIDLVLNSSNLQRGLVKYEKKNFDLKEILALVFGEKKVQAEKRNLSMTEEIKPGNYTLFGDVFWIKEALNNLIDNSIKYTQKGSVHISLEEVPDNKILVTVKDTGVGINEEDKKNLFTEGGRGKNSVKINVDSTGYGLYSVKMIIEAHQGKVWGMSPGEGQGSTFYIELPKIV